MPYIMLFGFVALLALKYHTASGIRKMTLRIEHAKRELKRARSHLLECREHQEGLRTQEQLFEARVSYMRELVRDLQDRIGPKQEEEDGAMAPASAETGGATADPLGRREGLMLFA